MISKELETLARTFDSAENVPEQTLRVYAEILRQYARDVAEMERQVVPLAARFDAFHLPPTRLPQNVLPFRPRPLPKPTLVRS